MVEGQPSRTAMGAAFHRAAHQVLEKGFIFTDPLACPILGPDLELALAEARNTPARQRLRLFIAVRSRFAEDALRAAINNGARQVVILGAGLDTYAYRSGEPAGVRIFEVDHPATQAWKRERLEQALIRIPGSLTFAPVDFERETLAGGLAHAGFDPSRETFFTWLGVVPYLTEQAVFSTLGYIGALPGGGHVVFDYGNPPAEGAAQDDYARARAELATRVASIGESLRSHFETADLHAKLLALGFREIEDLHPGLIRERYFPTARSPSSERGGHIVRAATRLDHADS
jgi:methyltransferase (TIGR00027 family)